MDRVQPLTMALSVSWPKHSLVDNFEFDIIKHSWDSLLILQIKSQDTYF